MRIALTQMDIVWEDKNANKCVCERLVREAHQNGADIIIFPEMTLTGFTMNTDYAGESDIEHGDTVSFFKEISKKCKIAVVFGMVHNKNNVLYNKSIMLDGNDVIFDYTKVHPFSYDGEAEFYGKGNDIVSAAYKTVHIGCFICYDLRFPEVFQISSKKNEVIIVLANWPKERVDHWSTLLKARAIENQAFILGVNRTGEGNGQNYVHSSAAYNPYGEKITAYDCNELLYADIDESVAWEYRENFPLKSDRREGLYKKFL